MEYIPLTRPKKYGIMVLRSYVTRNSLRKSYSELNDNHIQEDTQMKSVMQYLNDARRIYSELDAAERLETSPCQIFRELMVCLKLMDAELRNWEASEACGQ